MKRYLFVILALLLTACSALDYNPYASLYPTPSSTPAATGTASPVPSLLVGYTPTPPVLCTVIVAESLNIRTGPGTSYPVIGWLYPGDVLEVSQQAQGWANVRTLDGRTGWVNSQFCK